MADDPLHDFARTDVTLLGETKTVYRLGSGPAVIVMAEIPGITPKVADFARRVAAIGCTAIMPSLFGVDGKEPSNGYIARSLVQGCVSREFVALARKTPAPVTNWLRALAQAEHERCGGPGVGAVGMCFTGGFALAMMVDESVRVPVLSQPSVPFPVGGARKQDLGISDADLRVVKERVEDGVCVVGLRFTGDPMVPSERFERLRAELGDGFIGVEIDSSKGNPHGHRKAAHSVLTEDLIDEPGQPSRDALELVLDHFRMGLLTSSPKK
ncbi:MAG: dienelactone hydrolase [Acidimicrobiales bacterium]|nr:dienelactone hydrolase [Acidimicrobiales bacterium]